MIKKTIVVLLTLFFCVGTLNAQTVEVFYLKPAVYDQGKAYKYLRFGTSAEYYGGIMWNESYPAFGDGDDFVLFSYHNRDLVLRSGNGNILLHPDNWAKVGIGTKNPTSKLTVNGTAKAEEVIVEENIGADFVFEEDYPLPRLSQIEQFVNKHKHLPGIPSAEEMKRNGVKIGDLQMKLLQKIEELTLYVIALKKENREIKQQLEQVRHNEKN